MEHQALVQEVVEEQVVMVVMVVQVLVMEDQEVLELTTK
tara:strand:+ start:838 stop:954 length:117 start_codon:yes stop_codon:yes gene_type:complete